MHWGDIGALVEAYNTKPQDDATMRSFLAWCVKEGLTPEATADLTVAMARTGALLEWRASEVGGKVSADLPSTGGIGNKTPILSPLLALAAAPERIFVPKMSSRGRVAGTIDILESIGYRANLPMAEYREIVGRVGISNVVQTQELAPVDRYMMELRREVGAMAQAHLVVSSVLCKKLATGCRNIVIDVKAGPDSKFGSLDQTMAGARLFLEVGALLRGRGYIDNPRAVVTNNDEPQGLSHGRLVALQEISDLLRGRGAQDLRSLCVSLGGRLLVTAAIISTLPEAEQMINAALQDGRAFNKFVAYMQAHGADLDKLTRGARYQIPVPSRHEGKLWQIDVRLIDGLCRELQSVERSRFTAGIVLGAKAKLGVSVGPGDLLATVHTEDAKLGEKVAAQLQEGFRFYRGKQEIVPKPLILADYWLEGDNICEKVCWSRESRSALGLISREKLGRSEYLLRYNQKWGGWTFLSGHFEAERDQNFHETMMREFIEEAGEEIGERTPEYGRDFSVEAIEPPVILDLSFSGSARQWTKYEFHLFRVALQGDEHRWEFLWQRHPETFRWFTLEELQAGISIDGKGSLAPFPLGILLPMLS